VAAALSLLKDLNFVRDIPDRLGSTVCYQASAAGVLAWERREV